MTEIIMPLARDLVGDPPRPPSPRICPDDQRAGNLPSPRPPVRLWQRPVVDLLGAGVVVLGAQATLSIPIPAVAVVLVCWVLVLACCGHYARRPIDESLACRARRVQCSGGLLGLASWAAFPVFGEAAAPTLLIPAVASVTVAGLLVAALPLTARARPRLVVAGDAEHVRQAVTELTSLGSYDVVAACVPRPRSSSEGDLDGTHVHVGVSRAVAVARQCRADALVVLPGEQLPAAVLRRLQWQAPDAGVQVYVGTALLDVRPTRMSLVQGAGLNLVHVRPAALSGPRRLAKEVVERVAAILGVLLLLPAMLVVAAVIRLDSPGPALFRQTRVGRNGRMFTMYKFRTMGELAETERAELAKANECDDVLFKVRRDPRITRSGAWLRRYSVDELPQLLNVVLGDMSLVGPRPALPAEVEAYDLDPRRRLAVKPGLTGLWQVSGRSDLTWAESVRLDVRYVDNWSLALDLSILRRTVGAVLGHRGAY